MSFITFPLWEQFDYMPKYYGVYKSCLAIVLSHLFYLLRIYTAIKVVRNIALKISEIVLLREQNSYS